MATTGRSAAATTAPEDVAAGLRDAEFVKLVGHADGDALAGLGLLCRALDAVETPYQVSAVESSRAARDRMLEDDVTLALGLPNVADLALEDRSIAVSAYDVAAALGADPDPVLAIAGATASDILPQGSTLAAAREMGVEQRPGLGIPTADIAQGLAYSGLVHASFSGDENEAGAFLAELDLPAELGADEWTDLASAVAIEATDSPPSERAATAVERVLGPLSAPGPFETVEGYGDVLDALAREAPGTGIAHVLGHEDRQTAIDAWRSHGESVHDALARLSPTEKRDLAVDDIGAADPWTVARLARDFRVRASNVLLRGDDRVVLATTDTDARSWLENATDSGDVLGRPSLAAVESDVDVSELAAMLRGVR